MTVRHSPRRPARSTTGRGCVAAGLGPALVEAVEARVLFSRFVVDSAADAGPGTLRQAILSANANDAPTAPVHDEIVFNIPPAGLHTIDLATPLPEIVGNVTIDGTTQPGYTPAHRPVIELNGVGAGPGADGMRIASTGPIAASNVLGLIINGFSGNGVVISGEWNTLSQCYVGTDETAAAGSGNGGHGILITGDNNLVADSVVAFNAGDGVAVASGSVGNSLAPNTIFSNAGLGIDLGDDGPTPNDTSDVDDGANRRQNHPLITSVAPAIAPATGVTVRGTVHTTPGMLVEVVLYSSPTNDGEGRRYLDVVHPTETDRSGNGSFQVNLPAAAVDDWITATATAYQFDAETSETNTSEFSPPASAASRANLAAVYVRGAIKTKEWTPPFLAHLHAAGAGDFEYGFRVDDLPGDVALPWVNVNEVVVRYASAPTGSAIPTASTASVSGRNGAYAITAVKALDPTTYVLTLAKPLGGGDPVTGAAPLAKENGDRIAVVVPGGGQGGATYSVPLTVLQGDAYHGSRTATGPTRHTVNALDLYETRRRLHRTAGNVQRTSTAYSVFYDLDGSGTIDARDMTEVRKRLSHDLPGPVTADSSAIRPVRVTESVLGTRRVISRSVYGQLI